jgi:hypothetical protein
LSEWNGKCIRNEKEEEKKEKKETSRNIILEKMEKKIKNI